MKVKKRLCMLLMMLFFTLGLVFSAACSNNPRPSEKQEGPESGVYYYDSDEGEYLVSLNKGDQAVFTTTKLSVVGTYSVEGSTVTFNVPKSEQNGEDKAATFYAKLADNALTVTYEETECRFLKKVMYSVAFETGVGGGTLPDVSVMNGKTIAKPADPVREGYIFLGWYADAEYQKLYNFESEAVTKDTKIYARWTPTVPGQTEYEIGFDLNYEGAESVASIRTIGGKLYNVTTPQREGYDFGGWWVSPYNDPDKLSYACNADTVFEENLTLYAKWLPKNTGSKLAAPVITVKDTGISWTNTAAATYAFEFAFVSEDGTEQKLATGNIGQTTSYAYDFSSAKAGTYVVRVTSVASVSANNSDTSVVYYINKGLARVSSFNVSGDALIFNAVPHAEKYLITVDCGNKEHNHTLFDNGTSTYYNFSNCEMQEGGIKFTVTAVADGYASSTSETFVYERTLEAVSEFAFDKETETLSWKAVPSAASYVVTIKCGEKTEEINVGGKTKISLKEYAPAEGGIQVSVYPKTKGYNSPEASTYTYNKTALAAPSDIKILGTTLTWSAVEGAVKYEIRIGNKTFMTEAAETTFDLSSVDEDMGWTTAKDYRLSIRAYAAETSSAETSSWSDDIDIRYYALYSTLSYAEGRLSWRRVVGAKMYEVKINDGASQFVEDGSNSAAITFTRSGENVLSVRFMDEKGWSDWATISVRAYEVSFDSRLGNGVEPVYKAVGDPTNFPEAKRAGYNFGGWYNTPSGAVNGALYADEFFAETGDMMLYAYWTPMSFKVTYDCGEGNTVDKEFGEVLYGKEYTLDVPVNADSSMVFMGWYAEENGKGFQYTDATGKSIEVWGVLDDVVVKANWQPLLSFTKVSGGYSVVRNKAVSSSLYVNITIPETYRGADDAAPLPVVIVDGSAFSSCTKLENIRIPNSVTIIETTAFSGCTSLKNVEIYAVAGVVDPVYSSVGGSVIYKNPRTSAVDLFYVPQGMTGDANGAYVIPDGVTNLPNKVFNKNIFAEVVISKGVLSIEESAFYDCKKLKKVTCATGGTGELVFRGDTFKSCSALEEITLPARISEFNPDFFASCSSLQKINLEEGASNTYSSEDGLLFNKNKTELVYCPQGRAGRYEFASTVVSVADKAFYKCKNLEEVVFNGWMQSIGDSAFEGCSSIVKITFKGAANNEAVSLRIGEGAFRSCTMLTEVLFDAKSRVTDLGAEAFKGCVRLTQISFPASLTVIGANAFESTKLASVIFAENGNLTEIGASAFTTLPLAVLKFPASLQTIGESAFYQNQSLTSVEFAADGADLTIGDYAFQKCEKLESIAISKNVVGIGEGVFLDCKKLAEVTVDENNQYFVTDDGVLFDKGYTRLLFYPAGKTGTFVLPEQMTSIGAGVFKENEGLTGIKIGKNVTFIGKEAFKDCENFETVEFEEGGTEELVLEEGAFRWCDALKPFTLPNRVKALPAYFVCGNDSLTNFVIPDSVESIGESAFLGVPLENVIIPASVTFIDKGAFASSPSNVTTPMTVVFEEGDKPLEVAGPVKSLDFGVFFFNERLTSVKLPKRLINIADEMFSSCKNLKEITIPSGVTSVGLDPFRNSGIESVVFESSTDPERTVTFADGYYEESGSDWNPTVINHGTFGDLVSLKNVTLPKGTTRIADYMFCGCTSLERITIPNTITNGTDGYYAVGRAAFKNCTALKTVDFETGGTGQITIGGNGYGKSNPNYTTIMQLSNVGAFYGCGALETINFPENLASAKDPKGYDVAAISSAGMIFENCAKLANITVAKGTATDNYYYAENGVLLCYKSGGENILLMCAPGATGKVVVPNTVTKISHLEFEKKYIDESDCRTVRVGFDFCESVTEIEFEAGGVADLVIDGNFSHNTAQYNGAFSNMKSLAKVTLPARLTSLGGNAFAQSSALAEVVFEEDCRLTRIDEYAFYKTGFTEIVLPDSVKTLGGYLFKDSKLETITFPDTLDTLNFTFDGCKTLKTVNLTGDGSGDFKLNGGVVYKILKDDAGTVIGRELAYYSYSKTDTAFEIPADVIKIQAVAFKDNPYLQTLTFENSTAALTADKSNALVIGEAAFQGCTALVSVKIPTRLTTVGRIAFAGCTKLAKVTFEEDCALQTISEGMFHKCTALSSITIPKKISAIDNGAFVASGLQTVTFAADGAKVQLYAEASGYSTSTIPGSSTSAKYGVFGNCTKLETVEFNNRLSGTAIPAYTFYSCGVLSALDKVTINDVGQYAFRDCKKLGDGVIDFSKLTTDTINTYAFYGCTSLTNITLSESVQTIDKYAFSKCTNLSKFVLPSSVQTINGYAFDGCTKLIFVENISDTDEDVDALKNVMYLNSYAFQNCKALTSVDLSGFVGYDASHLGILYSSTFNGCTSLATVTLPSSLIEIGGSAFKGCTNLASLALPETLETIGSSAFESCTSLETITLSSALKKIGSSAFKNCQAITSLTLPESLETIDTSAFEGCANLASINLEKVKYINQKAFKGCESLTFADLTGFVGYTSSTSYAGKLYNETFCNSGLTSFTFDNTDPDMTNVIPARITSFGTKLFSNTKLVRVTFEDSDASLYLSTAFDSCAELVSVNFGTRQMSIPANAFKNCTSLGSISIGTGVSSLGKNAFSGCTNLTEVNIPTDGALKTVAENVFTNMANLQTVSFTGVGGTLTSIANNAFKGTGITEIEIPEGVTSIGKYAFQNCASLTKISLPASLTSIGENAIDGCDKLSSIDVAADNENFSFNDGAFYVETRVDETKVEVTLAMVLPSRPQGPFVVPERVTSISGYAFADTSVSEVRFMNADTKLENYAFANAAKLEKVTLPANLTEISAGAFMNSGLKEIVIPANITDIYASAFSGCSSLTSVTFEGETIKIAKQAFKGCTAIEEIILPAGTVLSDIEVFSGWTETQTIRILLSETEAGATWKTDWNKGCGAIIVWKTEEPQA